MRYLTFSSPESATYQTCFLVPNLHSADMLRFYLDPHLAGQDDKILAYDLFKQGKQTPVKIQREYLDELLPTLEDLGVTYLVTCDAEYFKTLTKSPSADSGLGYVLDSVCGRFKVIYCPNFRTVFYNPEKVEREIRQALTALKDHQSGTYIPPGLEVIKFAAYPETLADIEAWLQRLLDMNCPLTADIEAFSLKHYDAGIGTISFAWSKHEGIAFAVDLHPEGPAIRKLLRRFFQLNQQKMIWHKVNYDIYVLVYQLFMEDLLDTAGLLDGLSVMLKNWDCTLLITYLATNSCAGNILGLKHQALEFAGNYAVEDIKDIRKIPLPELLQYNLVDSLSTWFVYEKHWDTLVQDDQLNIYETLFKPSMVDIIQMQLTGLPLDMAEVEKLQVKLQDESDQATARMVANRLVEEFSYEETRDAWVQDFESRKAKAKNPDKIKRKEFADFPPKPFNPNSAPQLQRLLYDRLGLPVIDLTDTKLPATGGETLEKLKNHTADPEVQEILDALIDYKAVDKILTAFLPAFLAAPMGPDGWHYLFGSFNLGGTISGRLSSSGPNLQNLPAKGKLAKMVKRCFKAPPGFLLVGLDFASLEDKISGLTTKDPNKLKVYTDGYDGHSLRAYSYFTDRMPDIDPNSVESINSIAKKYPDERQDSKAPTFALTYQGTYMTLINNSGFSEALARHIEAQYHDLYRVSDAWVAAQLAQASQCGYVTVAFGLRLRTPLLHQVILGNRRTPYEAEAEGRTAGNALGQSWCLLNSRAGNEFMSTVRSGEYRLDIRPCAQIHDAQYFLIPDDMEVLRYTNEHLVKAVQWQDHPDIWHDEVKLGGELSIFFPTWAEEIVIPNGASVDTIIKSILKYQPDSCV